MKRSNLQPMVSALAALVACSAAAFNACSGGATQGGSQNTTQSSSGSASSLDAGAASDIVAAELDASAAQDASAEAGTGFRSGTTGESAEFRRLFSQAAAAFSRNDFTEAARLFRQLYDQSPSVDTAYNLARVYERIGESTDAIQFFQRVLQGNPPPSDGQRQDIEGRIARLRAYEARRQAGIAAAPATSDELNQEGVAWFNRGVRFFQRGQFSSALQAFEQASRYLQTAELDFNLGMTYERLRNYPRALEYLRQYLETIRGTPEEIPIQRRIREIEQRQ
jgi:tetratricopeptide (TPR) repeat protein